MKRTVLVLSALLLRLPGASGQPAAINDGHPHGDPPFLLEPGWTPLLDGRTLNGWRAQEPSKKNEWVSARGIRFEPVLAPKLLFATPEPGDRILNGPTGRTVNLVTERKFRDVELYVEFMVPQGSNSGVYLHGLYEVQIFDSFGAADPQTSDCGAIYHQWIDNKPVGGSKPRVNASRRPGEWQSFQIWFEGPRFGAGGKKTRGARFVRVLHNGQLVQENFVVDGPTRAHMPIPEAVENPIMLQGDHGPVAYRNLYVRPLRPIVSR